MTSGKEWTRDQRRRARHGKTVVHRRLIVSCVDIFGMYTDRNAWSSDIMKFDFRFIRSVPC